jgi:hypothetical protein
MFYGKVKKEKFKVVVGSSKSPAEKGGVNYV